MAENKWQAHRAGILNYWYYDEAEFEFADGRLMLRGSNGSGKSVTMQSLVTVLLDGVKRADRLDSFGSRSRRIHTPHTNAAVKNSNNHSLFVTICLRFCIFFMVEVPEAGQYQGGFLGIHPPGRTPDRAGLPALQAGAGC